MLLEGLQRDIKVGFKGVLGRRGIPNGHWVIPS